MGTFTIFLVLITIVCFLLIIVIMVQNPKGGGLSSSFGSGAQLGGVQKTSDFLDKSTWYLGSALIVLILMSAISLPKNGANSGSKLIDDTEVAQPAIEKAPSDTQKEAAPATANETEKATETPANTETKQEEKK